MASNARGSMRSYGSSRSPSFVLIGLLVVIVILGFNYWNASSRNSILTTDVKSLTASIDRLKSNFKKRSDAMLDKIGESDHEKTDAKHESENAKRQLAACTDNLADIERNLDTVKTENDDIDKQLKECETNITELLQKSQNAEEEARRAATEKFSIQQDLDEERTKDKNCESQSDAMRINLLRKVFSLFGQNGITLLKQYGVNVEGIDLSNSKSPLYQISPFGEAALNQIPEAVYKVRKQLHEKFLNLQPQKQPDKPNPIQPDPGQQSHLGLGLNPVQQVNLGQQVHSQLTQQNQIGLPPGHAQDGAALQQQDGTALQQQDGAALPQQDGAALQQQDGDTSQKQPEVGQNDKEPADDDQVQSKRTSKELEHKAPGHLAPDQQAAPLGVTNTPQESKDGNEGGRAGLEEEQDGKDDQQTDGRNIDGAIGPNDPLNPENKAKTPTEQTESKDEEQKDDNLDEQKEEAKEGDPGNPVGPSEISKPRTRGGSPAARVDGRVLPTGPSVKNTVGATGQIARLNRIPGPPGLPDRTRGYPTPFPSAKTGVPGIISVPLSAPPAPADLPRRPRGIPAGRPTGKTGVPGIRIMPLGAPPAPPDLPRRPKGTPAIKPNPKPGTPGIISVPLSAPPAPADLPRRPMGIPVGKPNAKTGVPGIQGPNINKGLGHTGETDSEENYRLNPLPIPPGFPKRPIGGSTNKPSAKVGIPSIIGEATGEAGSNRPESVRRRTVLRMHGPPLPDGARVTEEGDLSKDNSHSPILPVSSDHQHRAAKLGISGVNPEQSKRLLRQRSRPTRIPSAREGIPGLHGPPSPGRPMATGPFGPTAYNTHSINTPGKLPVGPTGDLDARRKSGIRGPPAVEGKRGPLADQQGDSAHVDRLASANEHNPRQNQKGFDKSGERNIHEVIPGPFGVRGPGRHMVLSENMNPGERKFQEDPEERIPADQELRFKQDPEERFPADQELRFKQGEQGMGPVGDSARNIMRQAGEDEVEMNKRDRDDANVAQLEEKIVKDENIAEDPKEPADKKTNGEYAYDDGKQPADYNDKIHAAQGGKDGLDIEDDNLEIDPNRNDENDADLDPQIIERLKLQN